MYMEKPVNQKNGKAVTEDPLSTDAILNPDTALYPFGLTQLEIELILRLREINFGEITVYKSNGTLVRFVSGKSEMFGRLDVASYIKDQKE